jgi:uncharacterized membrane protein
MTDPRIESLEKRVAELESKSASLETRLSRLEPGAIAAPPIQAAPFANPYVPKWAVDGSTPPIPIQEVAKPTEESEYQFGAQWLPRIGATLVVLGIAYLIGLGVTKGWITPTMLFVGAIALCLAFVLGGFFLREEREDFGQVLMGIGSCGMFATLAGGHVYQNLYAGETLVGAFLLWSLANLAYAFARSSRAFLAIGVVGGFIAALMPISKQGFELSLILNGLILVSASAIAAKNKFPGAALAVWFTSTAAMLPAAFEDSLPWEMRTGAIYLSAMVSLAAFAIARWEEKGTEVQAAIVTVLGIAALLAFEVRGGVQGGCHVLAAAAASSILAFLFRRDEPVRNAFLWSAAALATLLAPWGLGSAQAAILVGSFALGAGVWAAISKRSELATLSMLQIAIASSAHLHSLFEGRFSGPEQEAVSLGLLLSASIAMAAGIGREERDARLLVALGAGWAAISRLGLLVAAPGDYRLASFGLTASWAILGCALLAAGFVWTLRHYRYAGLTVLLFAVGKVLTIDLATATPELRVAVLIAVGLALLGGGYAYIRRKRDRFA